MLTIHMNGGHSFEKKVRIEDPSFFRRFFKTKMTNYVNTISHECPPFMLTIHMAGIHVKLRGGLGDTPWAV